MPYANLADYLVMLHSFQYPPASSLEGGNARDAILRAINCIPGPQNSHQGWVLGDYQKQLKAQGMTFNRGDKFVISVDCDEVLGMTLGSVDKRSVRLERSDGDMITLSGNESEWDDLVSSARNLTDG